MRLIWPSSPPSSQLQRYRIIKIPRSLPPNLPLHCQQVRQNKVRNPPVPIRHVFFIASKCTIDCTMTSLLVSLLRKNEKDVTTGYRLSDGQTELLFATKKRLHFPAIRFKKNIGRTLSRHRGKNQTNVMTGCWIFCLV